MADERGQASVELVAALPALLLAALLSLQLLAAGYALTLADGAAEAGALALASGGSAADAAREALPGLGPGRRLGRGRRRRGLGAAAPALAVRRDRRPPRGHQQRQREVGAMRISAGERSAAESSSRRRCRSWSGPGRRPRCRWWTCRQRADPFEAPPPGRPWSSPRSAPPRDRAGPPRLSPAPAPTASGRRSSSISAAGHRAHADLLGGRPSARGAAGRAPAAGAGRRSRPGLPPGGAGRRGGLRTGRRGDDGRPRWARGRPRAAGRAAGAARRPGRAAVHGGAAARRPRRGPGAAGAGRPRPARPRPRRRRAQAAPRLGDRAAALFGALGPDAQGLSPSLQRRLVQYGYGGEYRSGS